MCQSAALATCISTGDLRLEIACVAFVDPALHDAWAGYMVVPPCSTSRSQSYSQSFGKNVRQRIAPGFGLLLHGLSHLDRTLQRTQSAVLVRMPSLAHTVGPAIPGALSPVSSRVFGAASCYSSIVSSSKDIISPRLPAPTRTFSFQCCHNLLPPPLLNKHIVLLLSL